MLKIVISLTLISVSLSSVLKRSKYQSNHSDHNLKFIHMILSEKILLFRGHIPHLPGSILDIGLTINNVMMSSVTNSSSSLRPHFYLTAYSLGL